MKKLTTLIALLIFTGCTSPFAPAPSPSTDVSKKGTEITQLSATLNHFVDNENHYSFNFPKEVTTQVCGAEPKPTSLVVLSDKNVNLVTPEIVPQFGADGACTTTTAKIPTDPRVGVPFLFRSETVATDAEINAFLAKNYGPGCKMSGKTPQPSISADAVEIQLETTGPDEPEATSCFINYITKIIYSPSLQKIVKWDVGQAIYFIDERVKDATGIGHVYDTEINESFRFEN